MSEGERQCQRGTVRDVASKLGIRSQGDTEYLETSIQSVLLERFWGNLKPDQRKVLLEELQIRDYSLALKAAAPVVLLEAVKLSGFAAYKVSVIVANAAAHAVIGHGLAFLANAALTKGLAVLLGPVGWGIAGFLTTQVIAGEAYRVTIPCVLQITMIRRAEEQRNKQIARKRLKREAIGALIVVGISVLAFVALWLLH